jgi:hypothetical protein
MSVNKQAKIETNVLSLRAYNYLKLKTKNGEGMIEIEGDMTIRAEALLDVIYDKFAKQNNLTSLNDIPRLISISSWGREAFDAVIHNTINKGIPKSNCIVELDSREIRKTLGLPHFTDEQIFKAIKKLATVSITAEEVKVWYEKDAKYENTVTWISHLIRSAKREKTGRVAPRTKNAQHRFYVLLEDSTVMLFCNDAVNLRFSLFPKKFYSLRSGCQRLLRYLSLWSESYLNLEQIADILDWKSLVNIDKRKKQVEKILERLRKEGYTTGWHRIKNTRGLKTVWFIGGIDMIKNQQPKALKEAEQVK